jgi:hypothetical protein
MEEFELAGLVKRPNVYMDARRVSPIKMQCKKNNQQLMGHKFGSSLISRMQI